MKDDMVSSAPGSSEKAIDYVRELPWWERLRGNDAFRRILVLLALGLIWEVYATWLNAPLLIPTLSDTLDAFWRAVISGRIPSAVAVTLEVLLTAYGLGLVVATILTTLAASTQIGRDLIWVLTTVMNPLPAIALLPLALVWFGIGSGSIVFVVMHAVVWPFSLSMYSGFLAVPQTQRLLGQNYGLTGMRLVFSILIPSAFPAILSGIKVSWAFAWRTLIAAELVFGVSTGSGGLGWFIYQTQAELRTASVFAGLLTVILIGLAIEAVVFRWIEDRTVRRWGMHT